MDVTKVTDSSVSLRLCKNKTKNPPLTALTNSLVTHLQYFYAFCPNGLATHTFLCSLEESNVDATNHLLLRKRLLRYWQPNAGHVPFAPPSLLMKNLAS